MACKWSDFDGICSNFDNDIDEDLCCDEDGYCLCEEDPEPSETCETYEDIYEGINENN
jgi:hypothetical protein